jgi:cytochrome c peroxidase
VIRTGDQKQIDELAIQTQFSELGRFLVTKNESDVGAFKTSNLRNIGLTAPYMHDGSLATLWDVMDHYNKGGIQNPYLDGGIQRLGLTEPEIDDLVTFMFALTSSQFADLGQKEFARQQELKDQRPERDTEAAMGKKGDFGDLAPNPDKKNPADLGIF